MKKFPTWWFAGAGVLVVIGIAGIFFAWPTAAVVAWLLSCVAWAAAGFWGLER